MTPREVEEMLRLQRRATAALEQIAAALERMAPEEETRELDRVDD